MRSKRRRHKRQEILNQYAEQIQEEFAQLHPEVEGLTREEAMEMRERTFEERRVAESERLKEHVEVFSDAVIAIVATIMLLEIPLPSQVDITSSFLHSIVIFLTTFFIVLDAWWDNHKQFGYTKTITPAIVLAQFCFMGSLALLPIFARWMMEEVTTISVLSYGIALLVTNSFQWLISVLFQRMQFENTTHIKKMVRAISYRRLVMALLMSSAMLSLAFVEPYISFFLYLISPMVSFWHSLRPERRKSMNK